jgi:hypothetical protein
MTAHDFHTYHDVPDWRPKEHSEDEVQTAECRLCGMRFQESLDDDIYQGDHGETMVVHEALSEGWLRNHGYAASCEQHVVDQVHDL